MKSLIPALAAACALAAVSAATAQGESKTITGEIVGLKCYMSAAAAQTPKTDTECTKAALSAGEPAGIIDEKTGELYIAVSPDNSANTAKQLLASVNTPVEVKGDVKEREGIRTIAIQEIKELPVAPQQAPGVQEQAPPENTSASTGE